MLDVVAWPGGGLQLTASHATQPLDGPSVRVVRRDGSSIPLQVVRHAEAAGITALVITPASNEAAHAARLEAAHALIVALPPGERVGVWLGTGALPLLCELTEDRDHVLARVSAIVPAPQGATVESGALRRLVERLMHVGAPWGPDTRALVVVGDAPTPGDAFPLPTRSRTAVTAAVLREAASKAERDGWLARHWSGRRTPEAAGTALARDLDVLRSNMLRVGSCAELAEAEPLVLEHGDERVMFEAPPAVSPEHAALPCDPEAAARDDYPSGDTVTLELTPEELALHDRYDREEDESDLTLAVRIGAAEPVRARAHFRGQTSLRCGRKSYSVHFTDDRPRRLGRHAHGSEFYLLSLCKESGGFRQVLANRIMARLGLFPLEQRYVRLRVADRDRGVYLLLEKPDEHLKRNQVALGALIRRRFDPGGEPAEVKYPKPDRDPDGASSALTSYQAIVEPIAASDPDSLMEALARHVDLDNYLRWLALQSYFQCGDYVDETFFYASGEADAPYFRNLGWDTDDLFEPCHHDGKYASRDPHELLYCAEGALDRALGASPSVYHRYAEVLAELMRNELAPERVESELDGVRFDLLRQLVDDSVCLGMDVHIDGGPAACDRLRPWIEAHMDALRANVRTRAELLRQRLVAYGVKP